MATELIKSGKVKVKYRFPNDYNPVYVNGAWGGLTSQREICINFYLERAPLPNEEVLELEAGGKVKLVERLPRDEDVNATVLRYIGPGIVINLSTARLVLEFLQERVNEFEAAMGAQNK